MDRRALLLTPALTGTEQVLLQLDHGTPSTTLADLDCSTQTIDNAKLLELAEWIYHHVEEVWSGFNLLAEAVADGFTARPRFKKDHRRLDAWNGQVHMDDKVRMWVKNALIYGRCVMEAGPEFLKVRNPRSMKLTQDDAGRLISVNRSS